MPRTKATGRTKKAAAKEKMSGAEKAFYDLVDEIFSETLSDLKNMKEHTVNDLNQHHAQKLSLISRNIRQKTIGELMTYSQSMLEKTFSSTIAMNNTKASANRTMSLSKTRSASCGDDDGYYTAEGSTGAIGETRVRRSHRSKINNITSTARKSRSLSRNRIQRNLNNHTSLKTPANQRPPPNTFGTVTPKVKPNTPQVLLRRPKEGEMALSMQGSPLMVGSVSTDRTANVNIPLDDGRMLSIQPQRGLRVSQLPDIAPEVRRQIQMLRDNLNKALAAVSK